MHPEYLLSSADSPFADTNTKKLRNCTLPSTGIPLRWNANAHLNYDRWQDARDAGVLHGYSNNSNITMVNVNLDDVSYGGVPLHDLFINRDGLYPGAVVQGGDSDMCVQCQKTPCPHSHLYSHTHFHVHFEQVL